MTGEDNDRSGVDPARVGEGSDNKGTDNEGTDSEGRGELAELGSRLRQAREYLALSQQFASDKTGIARSAISDIERGQRKVDSLELKKFSKLYGYPVSYFLGEQDVEADVHAWARAMTDLTEGDRDEVLRFAQFLRFDAERRPGRR